MEELKKEISNLREFVVLQSKEIVKLKRDSKLSPGDEDYNRLSCIEDELAEQKRSQDKITKLCQAAIKALERIEEKPLIGNSAGSECSTPNSSNRDSIVGGPIDPVVVKSLCGQIEKLTSMLVKVDEDIDDLDERTEDNRQQVDSIREKLLCVDELETRMSADYLRKEVDARILIKDLATKADLSRGLKTIPFGLSKDEVSQMIDFATSNYLRTVQVCGEKLEDFEEKVNQELSSIQKKVKDLESLVKTQIGSLEDKTEKRMKEMEKKMGRGSGDLEVVVKELDSKVKDISKGRGTVETKVRELEVKMKEVEKSSNKGHGLDGVLKDLDSRIRTADNHRSKDSTALNNKLKEIEKKMDSSDMNGKIKTLQDSISSINNQIKGLKDETKSGSDEARVTARIERLGKEISVLKTKHSEINSLVEEIAKRNSTPDTESTKLRRALEQNEEKFGKVNHLETCMQQLDSKITETMKWYELLNNEVNGKMDKTDVDDLKTGMEKERCKIHYFQDRINNIAKSMDAVKQEINSMRDRFCTDIDTHSQDIKTLMGKTDTQHKTMHENSETLKTITKESITKIKDVSANCLQIEKNIRSIKDKSEKFEASMEWMRAEIKGLGDTHGTIISDLQSQLDTYKSDRLNSSNVSNADLTLMQSSVKSLQTDLKNLVQDKKTKDYEDEERKLSMESSLLDLRNYVENILADTNSHLSNIAAEVDNSHDKIVKCGLGLEDLMMKHDADKVDYETLFTGIDAKIKEISDYAENKQLDTVERILELRKEFVDKHADFLDITTNNKKELDTLKSQVGEMKNGGITGLTQELEDLTEKTNKITSRIESEIEDIHRKHSSRFINIETKHSNLVTEMNTLKSTHIKSNDEASASFNRLDAEMKTYESEQKVQAGFLDTLAGRLTREERDVANRIKEIKESQTKLKNEIETNTKQTEAIRKELDTRLDNCRRNILEIVSSSEIKINDLEDRIRVTDLALENQKVTENNHTINIENKLSDLKEMISTSTADAERVKRQFSDDAREELINLKRNLENLRKDLTNLDVEGFKSSINNTNTTQNKQLQTLFDSIDTLKKDTNHHTTTVGRLESRVNTVSQSLDQLKTDTDKSITKEGDARGCVEERVNNMQANVRDLMQKINQKSGAEEVKKLNQTIDLWKKEISDRIQTQQTKIADLEKNIGNETSKMRETMLSEVKSEQENLKKQIQDVHKNLQEKTSTVETKMKQTRHDCENQQSSLDALTASVSEMKVSLSDDMTRTDNLETAFTQLKNTISKTESEQNKLVTESQLDEVRNLVNSMTTTDSVNKIQTKLESMYAHSKTLDICVGEVKSKCDEVEKEMGEFTVKLDKLKEISAVNEECKNIHNKLNQQKSKLIDVEASVQFQERTLDKLGEDVKKINGSVFGNISNVDDRLSKLDETTESLSSRLHEVEDKSSKLAKDIESANSNKSKLDNKINQMDAKVGHIELEKLQKLVNDEVGKIKKEQTEIQTNFKSFMDTCDKKVESVKSSSRTDLEALKKSSKSDIDAAIKNVPKQDLSNYTTTSQFKTSISHLQDNIENLQSKLSSIKEENSSECQKLGASYVSIKTQLEEQKTKLESMPKSEAVNGVGKDTADNLKNTVLSLEKGMRRLEEDVKRKLSNQQDNQLSLIEKQRRNWDTTREKAEQMSQIFESLIITNDRPYVSCGVDSPLQSAGMIIFNQFELINKIDWEQEQGFNLVEPGVYILQISATISNCSLSVKLVSEQLEAELLLLNSSPSPSTMFKSRSTIFTVEDDDRDAEKIVVDILEKDCGESLRVDSDLCMIMYKISEVSNSENAGEMWRLVDE